MYVYIYIYIYIYNIYIYIHICSQKERQCAFTVDIRLHIAGTIGVKNAQ